MAQIIRPERFVRPIPPEELRAIFKDAPTVDWPGADEPMNLCVSLHCEPDDAPRNDWWLLLAGALGALGWVAVFLIARAL